MRHPNYERIACIGRATTDETNSDILPYKRAAALCDFYEASGVSPTRLVSYGQDAKTLDAATSEFDKSKQRQATTTIVLYSGARIARFNGREVEVLTHKQPYRSDRITSLRPLTPQCKQLVPQ